MFQSRFLGGDGLVRLRLIEIELSVCVDACMRLPRSANRCETFDLYIDYNEGAWDAGGECVVVVVTISVLCRSGLGCLHATRSGGRRLHKRHENVRIFKFIFHPGGDEEEGRFIKIISFTPTTMAFEKMINFIIRAWMVLLLYPLYFIVKFFIRFFIK